MFPNRRKSKISDNLKKNICCTTEEKECNTSVRSVKDLCLPFLENSPEIAAENLNVEEEMYRNSNILDNHEDSSDDIVDSLKKFVHLEIEPSSDKYIRSSSIEDNFNEQYLLDVKPIKNETAKKNTVNQYSEDTKESIYNSINSVTTSNSINTSSFTNSLYCEGPDPDAQLNFRRKSQSYHVSLLHGPRAPLLGPSIAEEMVSPFNLYDQGYRHSDECVKKRRSKDKRSLDLLGEGKIKIKGKGKTNNNDENNNNEENVDDYKIIFEEGNKNNEDNVIIYKEEKLIIKNLRKEMKKFKDMIYEKNAKDAENVMNDEHFNRPSLKRRSRLHRGVFKKYIRQQRDAMSSSSLRCDSAIYQVGTSAPRTLLFLGVLERFVNDKRGRQTVFGG